jgi:predicted ATPase/DNA-binding NarL/FixJ family response regulator/DNA-binding transcriptional regulator YiaG
VPANRSTDSGTSSRAALFAGAYAHGRVRSTRSDPALGCAADGPSRAQEPLEGTYVERESATEIASRIRRLRSRLGLSQPRLAAVLGVSVASVNRWEHAEACPSTLAWRLIARAEAEGVAAAGADAASATPPVQTTADAIPSPPPVATNLPIPISSFIGRRRELGELRVLLAGARLVTLTGPGGCGKTRLALELAREALGDRGRAVRTQSSVPSPQSWEGIWLVELASLADGRRLPQAIAAALGIAEQPGRPLLTTLAERLGPACLLVLDNCEHLREASARVAEMLLGACPGLTILATSRAPLGLTGETVWRVPPLSLPSVGKRGQRTGDREQARNAPAESAVLSPESSEAVQLLVERVRAVRSEFRLDARNSVAVAEICRRLDGLPLGIELVAAQASTLALPQIAARLADRFQLLTGGSLTRVPRQRTLQATLDWSYELLSAEEQRLFRRLSVFAGGFSLEAAEAVGNREQGTGNRPIESSGPPQAGLADRGPEPAAESSVLPRLRGLVEKSLVAMEVVEEEARYRLLETVREYAGARLDDSGEAEAVHARHAEFFLATAEYAFWRLRGPEQRFWFARLAADHDNLRAALRWFVAHHDVEGGLRLAFVLVRFWEVRGYMIEGREWLRTLLAMPVPAVRPIVRARGLVGEGWLAQLLGDLDAARSLAEESLLLFRTLDRPRGQALALHTLAATAYTEAKLAVARALYEESLALWYEVGDQVEIAWVLSNLGMLALEQADCGAAQAFCEQALPFLHESEERKVLAEILATLGDVALGRSDLAHARALHEESLTVVRQIDDRPLIGRSLSRLGLITLCEGDGATARRLIEQGLAISREWGRPETVLASLADLGDAARRQHQHAEANAIYEEILNSQHQTGAKLVVLRTLLGLGLLAAAQGDGARSCRLLAATEVLRERLDVGMLPMVRAEYEQMLAALRRATPLPAFVAAWAEGRAMSLDEAIAYALDRRERVGEPPAAPGAVRLSPQPSALSPRYPDGLSPREVEVLQLIAAGRSNKEIAAELVLSVRMVGRHITTLYGKIGARSRVDATNYAVQHGLTRSPRP